MVREYDVKIKMRVATYGSDMEVRGFAEEIMNLIWVQSSKHPAFITEARPTVEVIYDTRT